jgi:glyoxylase-like metal-dependent hydrolase (beta-lactamase superfamily II)
LIATGVNPGMDDIEQVEIPTPFGVGPVNCYLFSGSGLTILDPGPATDTASETLRTSIEQLGYELTDIERILITHPHMDHFGLARELADTSGAQVIAHEDAVPHLKDPIAYFEQEQAFFTPYLRSMGLPAQVVETVMELPEPYSRFQEPTAVDYELTDGDSIDVGVKLEAVHTPGHSPGAVCFLALSEGVAFTGDHVLADITPNPLLTLSPGQQNERTRSLPQYLTSLRKLRSYDVGIGYGGHGDTMPDLTERITETIDHHQERKENIANLLETHQPTTAYHLVQEMFPDLPATEMFPGMSEIIGHLDLLEDEGRVQTSTTDGIDYYELR